MFKGHTWEICMLASCEFSVLNLCIYFGKEKKACRQAKGFCMYHKRMPFEVEGIMRDFIKIFNEFTKN
jgi:hypothetical protein